MWKRQGQANYENGGKNLDTLQLIMPDPQTISMNPTLLHTCYTIYKMTGHVPNPFEVMNYPSGYIQDLIAWEQGVKFFEDYPKNANAMQGIPSIKDIS